MKVDQPCPHCSGKNLILNECDLSEALCSEAYTTCPDCRGEVWVNAKIVEIEFFIGDR